MKIAIVGTGYVGLVTGVSLALLGHKVICIDSDEEKVSMIKKGIPPFFEKSLERLLKKVIREGLFYASTALEESILKSNITIIAVGTPTIDNKIDLSAIKQVAIQIGKSLEKTKKYHVVAVKSTILPGTTEEIILPRIEKNSKKKIGEFGLCMNPEFLREGNAMENSLNPDRIVIGQYDNKSGKEYAKIYRKVNCPKVFTDLPTAELIKYAANALFATLISYSNEIARISENLINVDVLDVWKGVHLDWRLSPYNGKTRIKPGVLDYIFSGCGFGGSCFPKDVKALSSFADKLRVEVPIIKSVLNINNTQPYRVIQLLKKALGKNLKNKKITVLGLSFKPDTDDIRESVSIPIIEQLLFENAFVTTHDPMAYKKAPPKQLTDLSITLAKTVEEALEEADAAILVTSWQEYAKLTPKIFKKKMKQPIVVDGRRIYNKQTFLDAGIIYKGIGL